jgi:hypothetical protein
MENMKMTPSALAMLSGELLNFLSSKNISGPDKIIALQSAAGILQNMMSMESQIQSLAALLQNALNRK